MLETMTTNKFIVFCLSLFLFQAGASFAESSSEKIGRELHEKILQETPIYDDKKVTDYVNAVGQHIVKSYGKSKYSFTFTVIDDQTINAFALPGGYIYIHRGLLTYLNSEAELAAVLAHEVAHVTRNHHGRQKRATFSNQVFAGVLGVLTGSGDVAEASALWGQTLVSGFGREMELEADESGAEYLLASGYDPSAMIDVLTLLKDHERLQKIKARESGKKIQSYHGLFATHPRNDTRLKEAVAKAGSISGEGKDNDNVQDFRQVTNGLIWGRNFSEPSVPDNVYQDDNLAFRFNIPDGWSFEDQGKQVLGAPLATENEPIPDELKSAQLKLTVLPRTTESPDLYIKNRLNIPFLKKNESLLVNRLKGHTGVAAASDSNPEQRITVLYYGRSAFVFTGDLSDGKDAKEQEKIYQEVYTSFRPISKRSLLNQQSKAIYYVKATASTSFAKLNHALKLGKHGERELRIINGYYPRGEPTPGEWIKIIR